jgi:abhydrolase domain-containing protein 12
VSIGVWHLLPENLVEASLGKPAEFWEDSLRNSGPHRKELYLILKAIYLHLICFDYRGYTDSSQVSPSEKGVVADANVVYEYLRKVIGRSTDIFICGHSLGTGVSSHIVGDLCVAGNRPAGLILESPFTNIGCYLPIYAGIRYYICGASSQKTMLHFGVIST